MVKTNSLWRPPADYQKPLNRKRARFIEEEDPLPPIDEICVRMACAHVGKCETACAWMNHINGRAPLREIPAGEEIESLDYRDYNSVLAEMVETRREIRGEIIGGMVDLRKRAIVILIEEGFMIPDIARFFHCSQRTIYRMRKK